MTIALNVVQQFEALRVPLRFACQRQFQLRPMTPVEQSCRTRETCARAPDLMVVTADIGSKSCCRYDPITTKEMCSNQESERATYKCACQLVV